MIRLRQNVRNVNQWYELTIGERVTDMKAYWCEKGSQITD